MRRSSELTPQTCPGINKFIRPTMTYVKCHICGSDVEIWSDEGVGICPECGAEWHRPDKDASCLEYCEYSDKCREIIKAGTRRQA